MTLLDCAAFLRQHDRYLILTHRRPDGDAVGSAAALCRGLRKLGKTAFALPNPEATPRHEEMLAPCVPPAGYLPETVVSVDLAEEGKAEFVSIEEMMRRNQDQYGVTVDQQMDELEQKAAELLQAVHDGLFEKARINLEEHIYPAYSIEEAKQLQEEKGGFIKTMWCGELQCELDMKEKAGMTSRCIPFVQEHLADTCPICGKPAKHMIYWGVAY